MTSEEVQQFLRISRSTLYLWIREKKLYPRKAGRAWLFLADEVFRFVGLKPSVPLWFGEGDLEISKEKARHFIRGGGKPDFYIQYISDSARGFIRAKVLWSGSHEKVSFPAPGGIAFDSFSKAKSSNNTVFLGSDSSVWRVRDVRPETSPSGESYIALDLEQIE